MKKNLLIAGLVSLVALFFGAMATSTLSLVPRFHMRLAEAFVCPSDHRLEYQESAPYFYTDAEGTHRRANVSIECVAADGTRMAGKTGATIGTLIGIYFLLCFVPLLGLGIFFRWSLLRRYK